MEFAQVMPHYSELLKRAYVWVGHKSYELAID